MPIKGNDIPCIHLNGSIIKTNKNNFLDEIVLTSSQYFTNILEQNPWSHRFRADFNISKSVFFVGYSLYDFDIAKIIFESTLSGKRIFFIQHEELKRPELNRLKRFGEVYTIGIDEFANLISLNAGEPQVPDEEPFLVNFIECHALENAPTQPSDDDVFSLLFRGTHSREGMAWNASNDIDDYGINRAAVTEILDHLENEQSIVFVHGDIGNGKGYISTDIETRILNRGFKCFRHEPVSDDIDEDAHFFAELSEPYVLIIHDLFDNKNLLNTIRNSENGFARIAAFSRTAVYELRTDQIKELLGDGFFEVDINQLTKNEIDKFVRFLNSYGLWGLYTANSDKWKSHFIEFNCGGQLRALLLDLFSQPSVKSKIKELIDNVRKSDTVIYNGLLDLLTISATEFNLSFKAVSEILGIKFAQRFSSRNEEWIRELFDVRGGRQIGKSAILSKFILRGIISDSEIIESISELAYRLDGLAQSNRLFKKPQREILRFRFIEGLLSKEQRREKLVRFYEAVRRYGVGERNPQFWLQYAIARMSFGDYPNARKYFDTSFALAGRMGSYDDYQIKTHYARFLLESRMKEEGHTDQIEAFFEADEILNEQMDKSKSFYFPYRVASNYFQYCEKFINLFDSEQITMILKLATRMKSRISNLDLKLKKNPHVVGCNQNLRDLIDFLNEN